MASKVPSAAVLDGLRVEPKSDPALAKRDTSSVPGLDLKKGDAPDVLAEVGLQLAVLQQRLYAEDQRSLLVVLQGMDTSGKDGAIKHVFRGITATGIETTSFRAPADNELAHDFLWRVHASCPERGRIGIFNRSHYEDVVAARIRSAMKTDRVKQRYRHINDFERLLADEGTTVVKIFLHLSKDEQRERLQARLDDPEKRWKFRVADLDDRARWDDFMDAYEQAIAATSTAHAPWYVVPADRKWLRNIVVARIVLDTLERMDPQLPADDPALSDVEIT
jgi:PPK2 family polyphosphate:nucleotide phosphotransferase